MPRLRPHSPPRRKVEWGSGRPSFALRAPQVRGGPCTGTGTEQEAQGQDALLPEGSVARLFKVLAAAPSLCCRPLTSYGFV